MTFYMPTQGADDWKRGLADPEKQWKVGHSAYALAHAWEDAKGFPVEVQSTFKGTIFEDCELLLALPEHKVPMPAKGPASQNDLFVLGKTKTGDLVSITVEGKVNEQFGFKLSTWYSGSDNKTDRLESILRIVNLPLDIHHTVRYQLLHRMASAVLEAQRFGAKHALMLVHSFSPDDKHFNEYNLFIQQYRIPVFVVGQMVKLTTVHNINLYTAWIRGDKKYLERQEK